MTKAKNTGPQRNSTYFDRELAKVLTSQKKPTYPLGPYCQFTSRRRVQLKAENPKLQLKQLYKILKREWRAIGSQSLYHEQAKRDYRDYVKLLAIWKEVRTQTLQDQSSRTHDHVGHEQNQEKGQSIVCEVPEIRMEASHSATVCQSTNSSSTPLFSSGPNLDSQDECSAARSDAQTKQETQILVFVAGEATAHFQILFEAQDTITSLPESNQSALPSSEPEPDCKSVRSLEFSLLDEPMGAGNSVVSPSTGTEGELDFYKEHLWIDDRDSVEG